jgi:DNA-binding CsgD family transcriptional regulator
VKTTHDPHARSLDDARRFAGDPWAAALLDRLREEGLRDYVFVPLEPRDPMAHRWLGISSDGCLGSPARDELECFAPLIRAIDVQHRVVAGFSGASAPRYAGLSGRELAVLTLVSRGLTATAIANTLRISPRTVSKHQQNIYRKLDVSDRLTAVVRARELGMLSRMHPFCEPSVETIETTGVQRSRPLLD